MNIKVLKEIFFIVSLFLLAKVGYANEWVPPEEVKIEQTEFFNFTSGKNNKTYEITLSVSPVVREKHKEDKNYTAPIIYLIDGQWHFELLHRYARNMYFDKILSEDIIVVGIGYPKGPDMQDRRYIDHSISKFGKSDLPTEGEKFLDFIEFELIPQLESHKLSKYPVPANSKKRAIAGVSSGATIALYSLLDRPHIFSNYILSGANLGDSNSYQIYNSKLEEYLKKSKSLDSDQRKVIVMGTGSKDAIPIIDAAKWIDNLGDKLKQSVVLHSLYYDWYPHAMSGSRTLYESLRLLYEKKYEDIRLPKSELSKYIGVYKFRKDTICVSLNGSKLAIKSKIALPYYDLEAIPHGDKRFYTSTGKAELEFVDGALNLILERGEKKYRYEKTKLDNCDFSLKK